MEMTLERALELAGDALQDEMCPKGHRAPFDGKFGRAPIDHQFAYCSQCRAFYMVHQIRLVGPAFCKAEVMDAQASL